MPPLENLRIYLAGHTGLVGSALCRRFSRLAGVELIKATRSEIDLTDANAVEKFLYRIRPDIVIIAAGKVGGILANSLYPAEFIYENLAIQANLIHCSWNAGVKRLLNFGSACMYPKECHQPMRPDALMTGKMEPTSEPYAIAKLAGQSLCSSYNRQYGTSYVTAIPCNLYGPGDSFDPADAHVIPALMGKFFKARMEKAESVTLWGDGSARRELLYVEDLAGACELLLRCYEGQDPVNIGSGESHTIREIAKVVAEVVGFQGEMDWDPSGPEGAREKLLDSSELRGLGWFPSTGLKTGLEQTYRWFRENCKV
ncbi:MAG: GDP-L-fucose synthase [Deltaproteobacteria bacterium]|nr:GDP-L-fucose synthase [Deltaproteobacteria bacterium]